MLEYPKGAMNENHSREASQKILYEELNEGILQKIMSMHKKLANSFLVNIIKATHFAFNKNGIKNKITEKSSFLHISFNNFIIIIWLRAF